MSDDKGRMVEMTAADEHAYQAYHVHASGDRGRRGGLVVIQEIFGVNSHIRNVADGYAAQGYEVYAPALFDRIERGVELGYGEDDIARGIELMRKMEITNAVLDVQNCAGALRGEGAGRARRILLGRDRQLGHRVPRDRRRSSRLLLRRQHYRACRPLAEMPRHDAFRRPGCSDPDGRGRQDPRQTPGSRYSRLRCRSRL